MTPTVLARENLSSGYIKVERLRLRLASGAEAIREVESHGDAVAVLPYDPARGCALVVRLFRAPLLESVGLTSLEEACAGMIDTGDAESAVRREAMEELGLRLGDVEFVAKVWPSPGVSTETATLYLAPYCLEDRVGVGGGLATENEEITVIERSLNDLAAEADEGRIGDGKLLTLVLALRLRHPEVFGLSATGKAGAR